MLKQPLASDGTGSNAHRGLARRLPSAAAIVPNAVFLPVGIVGMPGPERIANVAVVFAACVDVTDQQRDRRPGGFAFEYAGQYLHRVGFLSLRDMARSAGPAAIEIMLNVSCTQLQPGRTAVDHAADRRSVAL